MSRLTATLVATMLVVAVSLSGGLFLVRHLGAKAFEARICAEQMEAALGAAQAMRADVEEMKSADAGEALRARLDAHAREAAARLGALSAAMADRDPSDPLARIYLAREDGAAALARRLLDGAQAPAPDALERDLDALIARLEQARPIHRQEAERSRFAARVAWHGAALGVPAILALLAVFAVGPALSRIETRARRLEEETARSMRLANLDPVTGLANRRRLLKSARDLATRAAAARTGVAALRIDIDRFRSLNQAWGHAVADQVLRHVARILRAEARADDVLARAGADEFYVIAMGEDAVERLNQLAERAIARLAEPMVAADRSVGEIRVAARAGIAAALPKADQSERTAEQLLVSADAALAAAKTARTRIEILSDGGREQIERRRRMLSELREAIAQSQIEPWFQPQICARTGRTLGFESLMRWRHPEQGVLAPGAFLALAEESGLIDQMGELCARRALAACAAWRAEGLFSGRVALNVSARELRDAQFVDKLAWDVEGAGLRPEDVAVEILESALIDDDSDPIIRNVAALAAVGFSIELDDFGTGHASISNLQKFRVDRIKIDRGFISGLDRSARKRKLAAAMIGLARSLEIEALAEGVETAEERRILTEMGCDLLQGFGIARPMPAHMARAWLLGRRLAVAAS
ncbi:putative bifunctional diguanylate cyclase/phosphodiesterase [Oceanicella actignis]|uniref:Diguanylate cyclase (GGDEF) domain-containing protein n=1 Tax=Oceanicella actignis TaxID=1189325 RepID=A0A1M7U0A1_9RHOB|nr:bifunctional diguanylate cyclase/phosphodiesterase [Oceanicella actignis]SET84181.1 diguanylate cyclase (GGDEF) domain-containing protein [Oceanicella actignis]SHN76409.1 diguanylate cyclase (GGDEF) domain-containing protein [Oceanicella actignis]